MYADTTQSPKLTENRRATKPTVSQHDSVKKRHKQVNNIRKEELERSISMHRSRVDTALSANQPEQASPEAEQYSLEEICSDIRSGEPTRRGKGASNLRRMSMKGAPKDYAAKVLQCGIVQDIVEMMLSTTSGPPLDETVDCLLWALANVASSPESDHTRQLMACRLSDLCFGYLMLAPDDLPPRTLENVLWILANLVGEDTEVREYILQREVLRLAALHLQYRGEDCAVLEIFGLLLHNLSRQPAHHNWPLLQTMLSPLRFLFDHSHNSQQQLRVDALTAVHNLLTLGDVVHGPVLAIFTADWLLQTLDASSIRPGLVKLLLSLIIELTSSLDEYSQRFADAGLWTLLARLQQMKNMPKPMLYNILSNILLCGPSFIDAFSQQSLLFDAVISDSLHAAYDVAKEAVYALAAAVQRANYAQLDRFEFANIMEVFKKFVLHRDPQLMLHVLSSLEIYIAADSQRLFLPEESEFRKIETTAISQMFELGFPELLENLAIASVARTEVSELAGELADLLNKYAESETLSLTGDDILTQIRRVEEEHWSPHGHYKSPYGF